MATQVARRRETVAGGFNGAYHAWIMVRGVLPHLVLPIVVLAIATVNTSAEKDIEPGPVYVEVTQSHMGMAVHLRVYAGDQEAGRRACRAAFERIAELNQILSEYEPDSELSRLVRRAGEGPVPVSEDLWAVLSAARLLAEQTEGLLDPTAAPVIRLWRKARAEGRLPDPIDIQAALEHVGYTNLLLDAEKRTAELRLPGMQLDLGAIAKGYIGDEAMKVLRSHNITCAMFEAGGDMVFGDPPPGETGWLVQPQIEGLPELRLAHSAAAISGDTVQFTVIDGRRYGHVIDPRTGEPLKTRLACLVTAPTGLAADPLATLGTIMPKDGLKALIEAHDPNAKAWVVTLSEQENPSRSELDP